MSPFPKRRLDLFPLKLRIDLARGLRLSGLADIVGCGYVGMLVQRANMSSVEQGGHVICERYERMWDGVAGVLLTTMQHDRSDRLRRFKFGAVDPDLKRQRLRYG